MTPEEMCREWVRDSDRELQEEFLRDLSQVIAAAVAVETKRCANVEPGMDTSNVLGWDTMTPDERRMWKAGYGCAMDDFAAAIRARNGSK